MGWMLWWIATAFFLWLAFREVYYGFVPRPGFKDPNPTVSKPFVISNLLIAAAIAYTPLRYMHFEHLLESKANVLAETTGVSIHCNTMLDSAFDSMDMSAGYANPATKKIVFQHPWCGRLMDHLSDPHHTTRNGVFSIMLFTHEVMHTRGESNEAIAECQAIQRYVRAAVLLGIPEALARKHGMRYYKYDYPLHAGKSFSGHYHNDECAPGKALDEKLPDSLWK